MIDVETFDVVCFGSRPLTNTRKMWYALDPELFPCKCHDYSSFLDQKHFFFSMTTTLPFQLYLSTRRGAWVLNRVGDKGVPLDLHINRVTWLLRDLLPFGVVCSLGESQLNRRFNHTVYGLKPNHR